MCRFFWRLVVRCFAAFKKGTQNKHIYYFLYGRAYTVSLVYTIFIYPFTRYIYLLKLKKYITYKNKSRCYNLFYTNYDADSTKIIEYY